MNEINHSQQKTVMTEAVLQKELTAYLNYSLPLCVILSNPKKAPWFYSHYTQLYSMNSSPSDEYLWIDYLEEDDHIDEVIEQINFDYDVLRDNPDIVSFVKEKIDNGYSVLLFLDELYLPGRRGYTYFHHPLQTFFYGYDDKEQVLMSIGFTKGAEFDYLKQSYEDVRLAYSELTKKIDNNSFPVWVKMYNAVLMKIKNPDEEYKFDQSRFIKKLGDYLFSIGNSSQLRYAVKVERGEQAVYGINTHDDVVKRLEYLLEGKHAIDYRAIHIIAEHKEMLHKKLCYFTSLNHCESILATKIDEYASIAKKFKGLAAEYKRHAYVDNEKRTLYGPVKNKDFINKAIKMIVSEKEHEKIILADIYEYLEKQFC